MIENEFVSGQQSAWCLLNKLGEGDAGEVYQVESLIGAQTAILKRPRKSAFTGDTYRQAGQIRTEARIIQALSDALLEDPEARVGVPVLLDQSKPGTEYNDRFFIVIQKAGGVDLGFLARAAQVGLSGAGEEAANLRSEDQAFLKSVSKSGKIPDRILIAILYRLTALLEKIHSLRVSEDGLEAWGIVWNDVKPDHLFWDAQRAFLTVIDWGNARFLDADRTTNDRQFSWADDYRQLFEEMGRFLSVVAPDLQARLGWPGQFSVENASTYGIASLKYRLEEALQQETEAVAEVRAAEESLLQAGADGEASLAEIESVHQRILEYGEMPDYAGALGFAASYAVRLTMEDRLEELRSLCDWAACLPGADAEQWRLIDDLARIPGRSDGEQRQLFLDAIQAAICKDWEELLWKVLVAVQSFPETDWWQDLTSLVRRTALGPEADSLRPLVAVSRITFALQAAARRLQDWETQPFDPAINSAELLERTQTLARRMKEEAIANWTHLDPDPPDSGLDYREVDLLLAEAGELLPDERQTIQAILSHPRLQVKKILEAWNDREFVEASRGLRRLLLWDPDRRRVLRAERDLLAAPEWLKQVHLGPQAGDNFPEWITVLEFQGRELRNHVGQAVWLDAILESCKQIRKGVWPSDLFRANPALLREMPWLRRFERSERVPDLAVEEQSSPAAEPPAEPPDITGVQQGPLGPEGVVALVKPLDDWMPEARGSSARVVSGVLLCPGDRRRVAAIKLMRMDKVNYSLPLFREEVRVLSVMRDVPGVSRLLECGFLQLDEGAELPLDSAIETAPATGRVMRIGPDASQEYLSQIEKKIQEGWIPYLAIEKREQKDSLLRLCDAGMTAGQFLPVATLLQMSIQICEILQIAHERNIVYRDHKILHFYWQAENNGVYMIDWNVARLHPDGLAAEELHMDLVQFGARGLHHILTGRTAPGALPLGPTRPEEIEQAAQSYQTQWTYDDQRLSAGLRSILERVLAGEYTSAAALGQDLKRTMMQLPDARL